ncbi:hypothetical protein ACTHGU_15295 [Chitinophagaceae bacterium MMS25-I14]
MKRLLQCLLLMFSAVQATYACNVCGCSAGNQYLGILPQFYDHFIGFQYQYRSVHSDHPGLRPTDPKDPGTEYYNTFQVWGRYYIGKRVQLFGFVPYQYNLEVMDGKRTATSGIGDASMLANVIIVKPKTEKDLQHSLLLGGGIKLPTGRYTGITEMDKLGLPNTQPGTGSWDFVADGNYTLRYKKTGINLDAAYTFTTANKYDYKYGNRLSTGLLGFYWWQKNKWKLLPQAGLKYEYTLHDYDNYSKRWLNDQTGGSMLFASAGAQVYYKQFGLQCMYHLPLAQNFAQGNVTTIARLETGLFFLF